MTVLLTRRAVVQAAMETTYNDPATLGVNDGVLVSAPQYMTDNNVLERDFTRDTLSQQAHIMGRIISKMEFETELRGNGKQDSGVLADAPIIARLFRACGYQLTARNAPGTIGPFIVGAVDTEISWVADLTGVTTTDVIGYFITVDTGGASGTAKVTITSDTAGEGSASQTITSGTELDVGTKGLTLTPTFTGNLNVGDRYALWLTPTGLMLKPISDNFESITLAMFKDGVKHLMPGSFGTFEITAKAGDFAKVKWTFTGTYQAPVDQTMPTPNYEKTLPSQVELARLRLDAFAAIVETFTFDQGNDIQIRPDVNSPQGYIGTRIVARKPEGGVNPEADRVANYDFWDRMAKATRMPFQMRIGHEAGNTVWMMAPNTQYSGMTYTDRQGILTYDAGMKFAGYTGDDEVFFFLC